jgi:hypothetical protein
VLSRSSSASRTADGEYLFWAEFLLHRKPPSKKGGQLNQFWEAHLDGLCPPDNRHGPILQKGADKCAIYLQTAVVVDEAFLLFRLALTFAHLARCAAAILALLFADIFRRLRLGSVPR